MRLASLQSFFIPWVGVFNQVVNVDIFAIADNLQYEKNSWINRNRIKNRNGGYIWLIIPLKKAPYTSKINERLIDNSQHWKEKHLKAIEFNYRKAPYFDEIFSDIRKLYSKDYTYLIEINDAFFNYVINKLELNTKIIYESNYTLPSEKNLAIIELCKTNNCNQYFSGPSAVNYLKHDLFERHKLDIIFQNCMDIPYNQIGGDWIPRLSIIDTLFMVGPEGTKFIVENIMRVDTHDEKK